jgi:hypothetical protein
LVESRHGFVDLLQQRTVFGVEVVVQVKATQRDHEHLPLGAQGAACPYELRHHFELAGQRITGRKCGA